MSLSYVIYLNTNSLEGDRGTNAYGYWTGKQYIVRGEVFPVTERNRSQNTKVYLSKKRAETAAENCLVKFGYVCHATVELL